MTLRDQYLHHVNEIAFSPESLGVEQVTVTPEQGVAVTVPARIREGNNLDTDRFRQIGSATGTMCVRSSDFPDTPPKGTITRSNGEQWKTGQEISSGIGKRTVEIHRDSRVIFGKR